MRSYILTITAAGILCAIVKSLSGDKPGNRMLSLACGFFLVLAAVSPIHAVEIADWSGNLDDIRDQSMDLQGETEAMVQTQMDAVIEERTAAYILDKGSALGADLDVEVILGRENGYSVPKSVRITGDYSPYIKSQISFVLEHDLGIPPEQQEWN